MTKCATCGGDGELYTSHRFDCPDCNGTGNAPDAAQQDPLLLEVLNFISRCQSLEVRTGGSEVVNKAIEREDLRAQANALYSKLDAVKWGVNTAQLPPDVPSREAVEQATKQLRLSCKNMNVDLDWFVSWKTIRTRLS